jgi:hypothetical protein
MEGLRIGKPAVLAEGENVNFTALAQQEQRRKALKRTTSNNEEEEVWSVSIPNIQNFNTEETFANTGKSVRRAKNKYNWMFNKPETPKAQMIKPKNTPPALYQGGKRKTKKMRKSSRRTQRRNHK